MDYQRLRLVAGVIHDRDFAGLDDEELHVVLTRRKQRLPVPVQLGRGLGAISQLTDLRLIQGGECDRLKIVLAHNLATRSSVSPCGCYCPDPSGRAVQAATCIGSERYR